MTGFPDGDVFLDPDASRDYLRSWKQRVDSAAARTQAMSERIEQLRTSATDGNGLAEVTIDANGVLLDLTLTERTRRFDPDVVARAVLEALRKARVQAADRSREIAVEALGPDSMAARVIGDRMRQLLEGPESGEDQPGRPAPGPGRE